MNERVIEVGRDDETFGTLTVHTNGTLSATPRPGIHPDEAACLQRLVDGAREEGAQQFLDSMPRLEDRWRRGEGFKARWLPDATATAPTDQSDQTV